MPTKRIKIILDTNFWISYLISDKLKYLDEKIFGDPVQLIFSKELIEEFLSVSNRTKFLIFFEKKDIKKLFDLFEIYGTLVDVKTKLNVCRDVNDNFLLNLAVDSDADYLVTGDQDLLEIQKIGNTEIISLNKLEKILETISFDFLQDIIG
jgi:uncharacterized protein